ncbi:pentatricopeptide repeat-containing protein-like [Dorcoceras hygrometricum]|uniref:Pentatricopeptide repeat-containing protein-like n=1 Tax=Dorcoceras hygrometricum TaxID=472368 RepID=A0A2Z7BRV8_9LAMI|nr:pentatricopeptide repeat-containing protein-like [Dorcoceras hygrometricum]
MTQTKLTSPLHPLSHMTQIVHAKLRNPSHLQTIDGKLISNPLYNFLPITENPNNIVSLVCSSLKKKDLVLWNHLQQKGLFNNFTSIEFSRVLLRCQSDSRTTLSFFKWVRKSLGLQPNSHNYSIMIHNLVWSKSFKQAMKLLLELVEMKGNGNVSWSLSVYKNLLSCSNECNWDPVVLDMLIKAYLKKGMVEESFRAFRKMLKLGFVPSLITVNCLLNGLSVIDCGEKCWDVYNMLQNIGVHPNACTFNILTHVLCKEGNVDNVNEFLERMEEQGFDPDVVTYNMLIDSYCKMGGSVREAHQLFHLMVNRELKPDVFAYNTLVDGYCKQGMMKEENRPYAALSLLNQMCQNGGVPSDEIYNELISSLCRGNFVKEALKLKTEMLSMHMKPNLNSYRGMVRGLCGSNRPMEAQSLMQEMVESGLRPDVEICRTVTNGQCKEGNFVEAEKLLKLFAEEYQVFDSECYNTLVRLLSLEGDLAKLMEFQDRMARIGFEPNKLTCKYVIDGMQREVAQKCEQLVKLH